MENHAEERAAEIYSVLFAAGNVIISRTEKSAGNKTPGMSGKCLLRCRNDLKHLAVAPSVRPVPSINNWTGGERGTRSPNTQTSYFISGLVVFLLLV